MVEGEMKVTKALIIGLGSTGQNVCENIAKNLNSKYGNYKNAKWLGIRVLETAYKSDIIHKDDFIDLSVDSASFRDYTSGAPSVGAEFAWSEWGDLDLIRCVGSYISCGAANVRMAGRLALFHNYSKIRTRIIEELARIRNLRPKDIQEALATKQTIDFDKPNTPINVYVVASLCGGTGSGCCVDMGYLIQEWDKDTRPIAFFTLPHPDINNELLKKNAFTALTELNHFCLKNNIWEQKLNSASNKAKNENYPYEIIYLTCPSNHMMEEKIKNEQNIASFLTELTSTSSGAKDLNAGIVDGVAALQTTKELGYLKPYFSTFGIASLEYQEEDIPKIYNDVEDNIRILRDNSRPSLRFSTTPTSERFKDIGNLPISKYSYALCPQTTNLVPEEKIYEITNTLAKELEITKAPFDNKDPYRITAIQTVYGASLAHISGIFKINENDIHALEASNNYDRFSFWNTRKDVNWTNCLVVNKIIDEIKKNWLVFTLIGKDENWYEIKADKFVVDIISAYNDKVGIVETKQNFNEAVMEIVSNKNMQIRVSATCNNRIKEYIARVGKKEFIDKIFESLDKIDTYYMGITKEEAMPYLVEYCFEHGLEQDYYDHNFPQDIPIDLYEKGFSYLWKFEGEQFINNDEKAPRDGFFCPNGHVLDDHIPDEYIEKYGNKIQAILRTMIKERFLCRYCAPPNNHYWPYLEKSKT